MSFKGKAVAQGRLNAVHIMKHILYWLGGFAVALGIFQYYETHRYSEDQLVYAQPPQNRTAVADFDALAYLNFLRSSANLPALTHSATLRTRRAQSCPLSAAKP